MEIPKVGKKRDGTPANSLGVRKGDISAKSPSKMSFMGGASKPTAFAPGSCVGNNPANDGYGPANHLGVHTVPEALGREKAV